MKTAILASQNKNKIREIHAILEKYDFSVISRDDAGIPTDDIEETGTTFEENSYIKASAIVDMIAVDPALDKYKDSPVIADDSGLMVDALDGAPGVYSARYAGEGCTYEDNNVKLLAALEGVPESKRGACFVTVITMIWPDGGRLIARGECKGVIIEEQRGDKGFGFDPLFIPDGYDKTFAEMEADAKNRISHRARALEELERLLG
jgi:XTP/dITP diphosphohydrolase